MSVGAGWLAARDSVRLWQGIIPDLRVCVCCGGSGVVIGTAELAGSSWLPVMKLLPPLSVWALLCLVWRRRGCREGTGS